MGKSTLQKQKSLYFCILDGTEVFKIAKKNRKYKCVLFANRLSNISWKNHLFAFLTAQTALFSVFLTWNLKEFARIGRYLEDFEWLDSKKHRNCHKSSKIFIFEIHMSGVFSRKLPKTLNIFKNTYFWNPYVGGLF